MDPNDRPSRAWANVRPSSTRGWVTLLVALAVIVVLLGGFCTYGLALLDPGPPSESGAWWVAGLYGL